MISKWKWKWKKQKQKCSPWMSVWIVFGSTHCFLNQFFSKLYLIIYTNFKFQKRYLKFNILLKRLITVKRFNQDIKGSSIYCSL